MSTSTEPTTAPSTEPSSTPSTEPSTTPSTELSTTSPNHEEEQYLSLLRLILSTGSPRADRTGTGTLSLFAPPSIRFNLRNHTFPLLTTKRVYHKSILHELLWFISGSTSSLTLSPHTKIWDSNGSRENLDALGFAHRETGDLGPVYGFQWRHFGAKYTDCHADYTGQGVDQLATVINQIRNDPLNRRIVLSAWNPADLKEMVLPPCHMFCQFYVDTEKGELSCCLYQRSADMGLGVPFNIASYALLTHLIAHVCGLKAGEFVHCIGDAHVYRDHVEGVEEQLTRSPGVFPTVRILTPGGGGLEELERIRAEDVVVEGYKPQAAIKLNMSV